MKYYVSVTGLTIRSIFGCPRFAYHAIPSMMQAKAAPGNVFADARQDGITVHYTLSVWEDKMSMRRFMLSGAHVKAMKDFDNFATGTVYGYESDDMPTWEEALQLLKEKGRTIGGNNNKSKAKSESPKITQEDGPAPSEAVK